jgi:hypothetical protein
MRDVNAVALGLLQFVEDSVRSAVVTPESSHTLLVEAQYALIVLDRIVRRDAPELYPFLAFFTDYDLPKIGSENQQPTAALLDALKELLKARKVFSD